MRSTPVRALLLVGRVSRAAFEFRLLGIEENARAVSEEASGLTT